MNTKSKKNIIKKDLNNEINNIETQIENLLNQKETLLIKQYNLENYDCFTKEEVKDLFEYLVSKKEKEKYVVEKLHLNVKINSDSRDIISQYSLIYLTKESNKINALNEIKEKYNIVEINNELYIQDANILKEKDISDNYIKLSSYNRYNNYMVSFDNDKNNIILININDERFNYVYDFIDELKLKKLDKKDFKLTKFEIKQLIDNFVDEYKDTKKLTKDIK